MNSRGRWAAVGVLAALTLALLLSACGGSGGESSSTGSSESSTEVTQGEEASGEETGHTVAWAEKFLEENSSGVNGSLPTKPTTPAPNKDIWILAADQSVPAIAKTAEEALIATEAAGWKGKVINGEGSVAKYNAIIDEARVAGADAVLLIAVDCAPVKGALQRAKAAGMPVTSGGTEDCDAPSQGGTEALFTQNFEPEPGTLSSLGVAHRAGELKAAWVLANVPGKKEVIQFVTTDVYNVHAFAEGFKNAFNCGECSIVETIPFHLSEIGTTITQKAQTAMLKHPNANVIDSGIDSVAKEVAQAIVNLGKTESVYNVSVLGEPEVITLIKDGRGVSATVGWDTNWHSWSQVDNLIRYFNHEKQVFSGWGMGIVDKEHLPKGEEWEPPVEFRENYEKLWGVK